MRNGLMTTASGLALAAVMVLASAPDAYAQTATANLNVSANVADKCTIAATPLNFGAYDPVADNLVLPLERTGMLIVRCTQGATANIGLDLGDNALAGARRMTDGTNHLTYELYSDSNRTQVWGNSAPSWFTPAPAPSSAARSFTVYGRVFAAQDVPSGNYADIVEATVNF
jgi:spore coat protein U-like protein